MTLRELALRISDVLTGLESLVVDDVELTLFARHTKDPKAHILSTNDDPELVIAGIRELMDQRGADVTPADDWPPTKAQSRQFNSN